MVDVGLGQHGVVLELALAKRRGISGNDDELGLSGSKGLEGRFISECDWKLKLAIDGLNMSASLYLYQTSSQAQGAS